MKIQKEPETGRNIVYIDFSTSRSPAWMVDSSADPTSLFGVPANRHVLVPRIRIELHQIASAGETEEVDLSDLSEEERQAYIYHLVTANKQDGDEELFLAAETRFDEQVQQVIAEPLQEDWERHLDEL